MDNRTKKYLKYISIVVLSIVGVGIFFNFLLKPLLPFLIAWLLAAITNPLAKWLSDHIRIPKKIARAVTTLFVFSVLGVATFLLVNRVIYELNTLLRSSYIEQAVQSLTSFIGDIDLHMAEIPIISDTPLFQNAGAQLEEAAVSSILRFGMYLTESIPAIVTWLVRMVPATLVFAVILIVLSFYVSIDYTRINAFISLQIPEKVYASICKVKSKFFGVVGKYITSYAKIMCITFTELLVGFFILGVRSPFILAAIISVADILPVLGVGGFLIPWAIFSLIQGNVYMGVGLAILYVVVLSVRNIIEPHIIGKSIGIPPFIMLTALYAGLMLFGVAGMFLFPITLAILKLLNDDGTITLWKNLEVQERPVKRRKSK